MQLQVVGDFSTHSRDVSSMKLSRRMSEQSFFAPGSLSFTQICGVLMVPLPDVDGRMSCLDGTDGDGRTGSFSDLCLESFG